jgi:hypothetical protein
VRRPDNRQILSRLLAEVAIYGGLPMRRGDIYTLAAEHMGERAGGRFGADYFAFHPPAVDAEPWPLEEARREMADD